MIRAIATTLRTGRFSLCAIGMLTLSFTACQSGTVVYQHHEQAGSLVIERIPPDAEEFPGGSVTFFTKYGKRELIRDGNGDCKKVFEVLLWRNANPEQNRLVVERKTSHTTVS